MDRRELTPAQRRALEFHEWELEGRGWTVWSDPVSLEPRFRWPQLWRSRPRRRDDGKVHRLPVRAVLGVAKLISRLRTRPSASDEEEAVPQPSRTEARAYLQLSLPDKLGRDGAGLASLLALLPTLHCSMSFEVIGSEDSLRLVLSVSHKDVRTLRTQLRAHLPQVPLQEIADPLVPLWQEREEHGFGVLDFGLSSEWMRPLVLGAPAGPRLMTGLLAALSDLDAGGVGASPTAGAEL